MNLFLDDIREPEQVGNYMMPVHLRAQYRIEIWHIVRNYSQFVSWIEKYGLPDKVSFDHDLADEHYEMAGDSSHFKNKTGYECALWLCDYCMQKGLELPEYYIHSMNPIGAERIEAAMASYRKYTLSKVVLNEEDTDNRTGTSGS